MYKYKNATAVTPNDSTDLTDPAKVLIASGAGNVKVTTEGGQTVTIGVAAGIPLNLAVRRVYSTDTTATGIVVLW